MDLKYLTRFRDILWFSARRYTADNHSQRAVALTYYTVFAIVPMAALLFGIAKGFDLDMRLKEELSRQLYQHKEILDWICKFADTTLKQAQGGIVAGVGVIALIWTVLWLASNIEKSFNDIWNLPSRKNIFRRFSDFLALILITPLLLVTVGASGVTLRSMFNKLAEAAPDLGSTLPLIYSLSARFSPLLIFIVIFTLIYLYAPNTRVRFRCALLAGVVAGLLFQLLQDGFLLIQSTIFRYNRIYGTFAILPLFLVWLQWSWQIVLFGAEIGFVSQNFDTGTFDNSGNTQETLRMRSTAQLACAALIYNNFSRGEGALSGNEISRKLHLPENTLKSCLNDLVSSRIINQLADREDPTYAPGFPSETFTAGDCLKTLAGAGQESSELAPALANVRNILDRFDRSYCHTESDPLLKDLWQG